MSNKPDNDLLRRVAQFSTPELCDGMGLYNAMHHSMKPRLPSFNGRMVGPAFTVKLPFGAGGFVPTAIETAPHGSVLVLAGGGNLESSLWGDHRSLCAQMRGLAGVVVDGAFRDVEGCDEVGFPVFARALVPGTAVKNEAGETQVPVVCAGAAVNPGDIVVGDANGVVVLPLEQVEEIVERAAKKVAAQEKVIAEMKQTGQIIPRIKVEL